MTKTTIATKLAELIQALRNAEHEWYVAEKRGDVLININPLSEECKAACKYYHEMRVQVLQIKAEMRKLTALL